MATETNLKVNILSATPNVEIICAAAARQCYTAGDALEIIDQLTPEKAGQILEHCIKSGHLAVLANGFVAVATNITRESLTQLNTHAFIKTLTQSQQYVDHRDFIYHIPDALKGDEVLMSVFKRAMNRAQDDYNLIKERLIHLGHTPEEARMSARSVLPNAAEANTILSGNTWAWFNWLQRRVCKRNTPVTLELAQKILKLFREQWPSIFGLCGAPCEFGKCLEQKPCGKPYKRNEVA